MPRKHGASQPRAGSKAACFLGIRPGVTMLDDAERLLRDHPWVARVERMGESVAWRWNGAQPRGLFETPDWSWAGMVSSGEDGAVTSIYIVTSVPFGDFLNAYGPPDREDFFIQPFADNTGIARIAGYARPQIEVQGRVMCPVQGEVDLWRSAASVVLSDVRIEPGAVGEFPPLPPGHFCRR